MKNALKAVCVILVLWLALTVVDCVRLRYADSNAKPLITLRTEETEHRLIHHGFGYRVIYYADVYETKEAKGSMYVEHLGYGAEFRVLNILLWAWVE